MFVLALALAEPVIALLRSPSCFTCIGKFGIGMRSGFVVESTKLVLC